MSISFVLPCFNEEKNLNGAYNALIKAIKKNNIKYEIIFINDGSSDHTLKVLKQLKKKYNHIQVLNNKQNRGFGYSFKLGSFKAKMKYVQLLPSDNTFPTTQLSKMIKNYQKYDLILSYHFDERIFIRRFISKAYTSIVNLIFGYNYKYYNGITIIKKNILEKINFKSSSPFFMAEIILKASKMNKYITFKKLYFEERKYGKSNIFSINSIYSCLKDMIKFKCSDWLKNDL